MSRRYNISNEFFPFNYFSTPTNPLMIRFSSGLLKIWGFIKFNVERDPRVTVEKLREAGVNVHLDEVRGAMHGFDTKLSAPTTRRMVLSRVQFMKKMFR